MAPATRWRPTALWELGAEVVKIGVEPNGLNINDKCGSTSPEALCDKVREMRADIGIALDGDADRVVIVDEKGHIVDGDQIMAVIAESWHRRGQLPGGGVVATVMSNLGLERYLTVLGLQLERTPVGDRYVVEHMRKHGYNVGGEQSGHIVLSDFTTTGDGLVTALQVLSVVVASGKPVSEVCKRFEPAAADPARTCATRTASRSSRRACQGHRRAPRRGWASTGGSSSARPAPSR